MKLTKRETMFLERRTWSPCFNYQVEAEMLHKLWLAGLVDTIGNSVHITDAGHEALRKLAEEKTQ